MNEELYDELVGNIYEASMDASFWLIFLEKLSEILDSRGTLLYLVDYANRYTLCQSDESSFIRSARMDPSAIQSYDNYYSKVNVWLERSSNLPEGVPVTTGQLYTESDLRKTEWHGDWLVPHNYFRALTGNILKQDTMAVRLTAFRTLHQPNFEDKEIALFGRLMPHLRRACKIHKKFSEIKGAVTAETEVLERLGMGVILFDEEGRALFCNQMAKCIATRSDGFRIESSGRCSAATATATRDLRNLLSAAAFGQPRQGGALGLPKLRSGQTMMAMVTPLPGGSLPLLGRGAAAVLFLSDPDLHPVPDANLLSRCYGLTLAEARLAAALVSGASPNDYSQAQGVSQNTVKTQLKRIFSKTGVQRQAELVKLLLASPATLAPAPDRLEASSKLSALAFTKKKD